MYSKVAARNVPELPFDIYEHISKFLSDEDIWGLYAVNRTFYELSQRRRHKETTLMLYWNVSQNGKWGRHATKPEKMILEGASLSNHPGSYGHIDLYSSEVINRLRSFKLVFDLPVNTVPWIPGTMHLKGGGTKRSNYATTSVSSYWRMFSQSKASPFSKKSLLPSQKPSVSLKKLSNFVQSLTQVDDFTLTIKWTRDDKSLARDYPSFHPTGIPALVSLDGRPSERMFALCLFWCRPKSGRRTTVAKVDNCKDIHRTTLIPFIKAHSQSLRSLTVKVPHPVNLFRDLEHLPSLQALEIEEDDESPLGLYQFLQKNSETLTKIIWRKPTFSFLILQAQGAWFDQQTHGLIPFPKLRVLELRGACSAFVAENPRDPLLTGLQSLLHSYRLTLTKLCLTGYSFCLGHLYQTLKAIASPVLEFLEIHPYSLTYRVFATMANNLPCLQILRLSYYNVGHQSEGAPQEPSHCLRLWSRNDLSDFDILSIDESLPTPRVLRKYFFRRDMQGLYLPDWNVKELYLTLKDQSQPDWKVYALGINSAVLQSLPCVLTFNGRGRNVACY